MYKIKPLKWGLFDGVHSAFCGQGRFDITPRDGGFRLTCLSHQGFWSGLYGSVERAKEIANETLEQKLCYLLTKETVYKPRQINWIKSETEWAADYFLIKFKIQQTDNFVLTIETGIQTEQAVFCDLDSAKKYAQLRLKSVVCPDLDVFN